MYYQAAVTDRITDSVNLVVSIDVHQNYFN